MKIISITKTNKRQKMLPAFFVALTFVFTGIFSSFNPAEAAFNKEINYQGKLTTANSIAVADGTYNMEFKLYTSGGITLWTETRTGGDRVPVSSGLFSVMLGELSSLSTVDFNQTLYLGVNIGGTSATPAWDGEMTPRKKLGVVPAAIESERAATATKSTNLIGGNSTSLLGAVPYQSDTDTTSFVSPNVTLTKKFFSMTGTGTNGAVPLWEALVAGDVGLGNVTNESKATMFTAPTFTGSTLITGDLTVADEANTVRTFLKPINDSGAVGTSSNHPLGFYTNNSQVATILTNGNFGIGTTNPLQILDISNIQNGTTRASITNTDIGSSARVGFLSAGSGGNVGMETFGDNYTAPYGGSSMLYTSGLNNKLFLGTVGTQRMVIDTTGNVGIGTTGPNFRLDVVGGYLGGSYNSDGVYPASDAGYAFSRNFSGGGNEINLWNTMITPSYGGFTFLQKNGTSTAVELMTIRANSNVGIGSTNPSATLHVSYPTSSRDVSLTYDAAAATIIDNWGAQLAIGTHNGGAGGQPVYLQARQSTNIAWNLVLNPLGGNVGIGTTGPESKLHIVGAAGNMLQLTDSSSFYYTKQNAGSIQARTNANEVSSFSLNPDGGNVGIGTTSPTFKLEVNGAADTNGIKISSVTTGRPMIKFANATTGNLGNIYYTDSKDLVFETNGGSTEGMRILAGGNVGVGTTVPAGVLHLKGSSKFVVESTSGAYGQQQILNTADGESSILFANNVTGGIGGAITVSDAKYLWGIGLGRFNLPRDVFSITSNSATAGIVITSNGYVGIGTTAPWAGLSIFGKGDSVPTIGIGSVDYGWNIYERVSDGDLLIKANNNNVLTNVLALKRTNGNVGIGTTTPNGKLQIGNNLTATTLWTSGGTYTANEWNTLDDSSTDELNGTVGLTIHNNNTTDGNWARLSFSTYEGTGGNNISAAMISARFTNRVVNSWGDGDLAFSTNYNSGLVERMRILANGNIGIGTTAPLSSLEIYKSHLYGAGVTDILTLTNAPTGNNPDSIGLAFRHNDTGNHVTWYPARIVADKSYDGTNFSGSLYFQTKTSDTSQTNLPTTKMTILENGNIGIGTTTPDAALSIVKSGGLINLSETQGAKDNGYYAQVQSYYAATTGFLAFHGGGGAGKVIGSENYGTDTSIFANATERIRILNSGNVGIGTATPIGNLNIEATTVNSFGHLIVNRSNSGGLGGQLLIRNAVSPAVGNAAVLSFELDGTTAFGGVGDNAGNAEIRARVNNTNAATDLFFSNWSGFAENINMTIASTGNVGIGTTNPASKLEVVGDIEVGAPNRFGFRYSAGDGSMYNYIGLAPSGGLGLTGGLFASDPAQEAINFTTRYSTSALSINNTGNVGIGTTSPSAGLSIYRDGSDRKTLFELNRSNYPGLQTSIDFTVGANIMVGRIQHEYVAGDHNDMSFSLRNPSGSNFEIMRLGNDGNVGIGTTEPGAKLEVSSVGAGYSGTPTLLIKDTSGRATLTMQSIASENTPTDIFTKIGTKWAWSQSVRGDNENRVMQFFGADDAGTGWNSAGVVMTLTRNGYVGIGTTTPGNILTIQQTSATDPIADAWTTYSSGRWKENRVPIVNILEKINELNPVYYDWTAEYGGAHDLGFIAEEVGLIIPEVVAWEDNGVDAKSIDYARLSTIAIAGIKEMNLNIGAITGTIIPTPGSQEEIFANNFFDNIFAKVGSWLGDIDNGLEKIFVKEIRTKKLCVLDEEGVETCVIKSQLDALLASAGESGAGVGGGDTAGGADVEFNPKAPVVTLNGDAVINLIKGDTYEEQGAVVTDDVDVDLVAIINGEVDTSVVGSYTLSYIVTDTEGYMSIPVVRTVNVEEPAAPASSSAPSVPEAEADTDTPPAPSVTTTGTLSGGSDTSTSSGATTAGDSDPATPSGDTTTGA